MWSFFKKLKKYRGAFSMPLLPRAILYESFLTALLPVGSPFVGDKSLLIPGQMKMGAAICC